MRTAAALGMRLEMTTTAEGIETEEQFLKIRDQGDTHVQGYWFGRPTPLARANELCPTNMLRKAAAGPA